MAFATFHIKGYKNDLMGISKHIDRSAYQVQKSNRFEDQEEEHIGKLVDCISTLNVAT